MNTKHNVSKTLVSYVQILLKLYKFPKCMQESYNVLNNNATKQKPIARNVEPKNKYPSSSQKLAHHNYL